MAAPKYFPLQDFGKYADKERVITYSPCWAIAVVRLGSPLSFDRQKMASKDSDITAGAFLRADKPLVIVSDVESLTVSGQKGSHIKTMSATLKNSKVNYLTEILPGDWVFAWMLYGEDKLAELIDRIAELEDCNRFDDGFKFVGRVSEIFKDVSVSPSGVKKSSFSLSGVGFNELNTQLYYDMNLASKDLVEKSIGSWLARLGKSVEDLFRNVAATGVSENNVNVLIPTLLDLLIGDGAGKDVAPTIATGNGSETVSATASNREAPYAYIIPTMVGKLLGREADGFGTKKAVLAYSAILELLQGVQSYSASDDADNTDAQFLFVPELKSESKINRRICKTDLLGSFLPYFPELANKPLWNILRGYLNPEINEMYTCLRVNPEGKVMPTIVLRQIPFTTNEFDPSAEYVKGRVEQSKNDKNVVGADVDAVSGGATGGAGGGATSTGSKDTPVPFTRFLDLPRWVFMGPEVKRVKLGRSDVMRTNFVHVYGANLVTKSNVLVSAQIVNNPPIRDDIDIQRSGVHAHMAQINCAVQDEHGGRPGIWMALVADRMMGAQYTLSGNMSALLVRAPICEGDNLEFDNMVFHIESVTHSCSIDERGQKTATTSLTLTNGMRSDTNAEDGDDDAIIYAGFKHGDAEGFDPGVSAEGRSTTGDVSDESGSTEAERQRAKDAKAEDAALKSAENQDAILNQYKDKGEA